MKRILIALLLAVSIAAGDLFVSIPASAVNDELTYGDFRYTIDGSEITITKYNGNESYVEIPDIINGRYVTVIDRGAFTKSGISNNSEIIGNDAIENVRLPNHLKEIRTRAFTNCSSLKSIVLPNSVEFIGFSAFSGCSSLSEVVMGKNITRGEYYNYGLQEYSCLSDLVFLGCDNLSVISLSEGIKSFRPKMVDGWFSYRTASITDVYFRSDFGQYQLDYIFPDVPLNIHYPTTDSYNHASMWDDIEKYYADMKIEYGYSCDVIPLAESHSKVTFDTNGGDTPNSEIWTLNGQMVSEEIPPTKKDCEFIGWYTNREGNGKKWDFTTDRVYSNMTLYAKFRPAQYTVTFDSDGGNCDTKIKEYSFGLAMGDLPVPTKLNFTFIGWYTRPDANGELYTSSTIMPRSSITLYASWLQQGKSLVVNYDSNGGKCSVSKSLVEYDKCIDNLPIPTKEGNTFIGWNTSPDGNGDYYTTATRVKQPYITLYAMWKADSFTVYLKLNGGTIDSQTKQVEYGSKIGTLPTPLRNGYEFSGWYYSDGSRFSSSDTMPAKTITLNAKWTGFEYMILFDPRGGHVSTDTKYVSCGKNVGYLYEPTRKGYKFMGWYTKPNCKGSLYTSNTEMPEKDITLYAGWKKITDYASNVTIDKTKLTMGVGQKYSATITTVPAETIDKFTWTSSNTKVALVNSKGVITALQKGLSTITVTTSKGKTASMTVTIKKAVSSLKVPYTSRKINVGQIIKITPTANGYAGVLTWNSSSPSVAKVDSKGNVTGLKKGTAIITVKAYNGVSTIITLTVK